MRGFRVRCAVVGSCDKSRGLWSRGGGIEGFGVRPGIVWRGYRGFGAGGSSSSSVPEGLGSIRV